MMNRNIVFAFVAILTLIGLGLFVAGKNATAPVATSTGTSTAESIRATSTITVDWTKVGKDRLYTEEEGKYENLTTEEKEAFKRILGFDSSYTKEDVLKYSVLLSLHNGYALMREYQEKPGLALRLYNVKNDSILPSDLLNPIYPYALSSTTLVFVDEKNIYYYKPGFSKFEVSPGSLLDGKRSYTYLAGMGFPDADVSTTTKSITVGIYSHKTVWEDQSERPKPIGQKTFRIE